MDAYGPVVVVAIAIAVLLWAFISAVRDWPRLGHHLLTAPLLLVWGAVGVVALVVALAAVALLVAAALVGLTVTSWFPLDLTVR